MPEPKIIQLKELLQRSKEDPVSKDKLHKTLITLAEEAAKHSYSPYSSFPVGAVLLTREGEIFSGCNVENASYGGTICAERTAIVKAVSEGHRNIEIIAVACLKLKDGWPCGLCRQFIAEFGLDIEILSQTEQGKIQCLKINELLPRSFGPSSLGH